MGNRAREGEPDLKMREGEPVMKMGEEGPGMGEIVVERGLGMQTIAPKGGYPLKWGLTRTNSTRGHGGFILC